MKNLKFIAFIILVAPALSLAQERSLYEISQDMLTLTDKVIYCASGENMCTEAEALILKAETEDSLRDLVKVIKSGDIARHRLSVAQIHALAAKTKILKDKLLHAKLFYRLCNFAAYLFSLACLMSIYGLVLLAYVLMYITNPFGIILAALIFVIVEFILLPLAIILLALASLMGLSCLFWWL